MMPAKITITPIVLAGVTFSRKISIAQRVDQQIANALFAYAMDRSNRLMICCQKIAYTPRKTTSRPSQKSHMKDIAG